MVFLAALLVAAFLRWRARRLLRLFDSLPDFGHKTEMAEQVKGEWLRTGLWIAALSACPLLGFVFHGYWMTSWLGGLAAIFLVIDLEAWTHPRAKAAWALYGAMTRARWRNQPFDLDQWLALGHRRKRRTRLSQALIVGFVFLTYAYLAVAFGYPFDRSMVAMDRFMALQTALERGLKASDVKGVAAGMPSPLFSLQWPFPRHAEDEIGPRLLAKCGSDHVLFICMNPGASETRGKEMLAAGRAALGARDRHERWAIWVTYGPEQPHHPRPALKGWYEPTAAESP
jgi:hypothetical protein